MGDRFAEGEGKGGDGGRRGKEGERWYKLELDGREKDNRNL